MEDKLLFIFVNAGVSAAVVIIVSLIQRSTTGKMDEVKQEMASFRSEFHGFKDNVLLKTATKEELEKESSKNSFAHRDLRTDIEKAKEDLFNKINENSKLISRIQGQKEAFNG